MIDINIDFEIKYNVIDPYILDLNLFLILNDFIFFL